MMIPALACSVELITVDSQLHPLRRGALLTDPEICETLAVPRVGSQPPSIAGNFSNLDDAEAGLREILAASFAHVEPEAVGSIAIFAAAAPRAIGQNRRTRAEDVPDIVRHWQPPSTLPRPSRRAMSTWTGRE